MVILFVKILAWIFLFIGGAITTLRLYGWYDYNCTPTAELQQTLDAIKGVRRVFPIHISGTMFLVSLAAIIATWGS
jgi:hypothetical protein